MELPPVRHNPYFSRWFSAMCKKGPETLTVSKVTILILVDGFLQSVECVKMNLNEFVTILILVDGFLQCIHNRSYN